jgi:hypothetical protein
VQRVGESLTERPAAEPVDDRDLVVAEPVGVVLVDIEPRVVDEELPYLPLPEGDGTCPSAAYFTRSYSVLPLS